VPTGPPPDPYVLHDRIQILELKFRALERCLTDIFTRVNVNRIQDPDVERAMGALSELNGALSRIRWHPPAPLRPPNQGLWMGASLEEELPVVGPEGRGTRYRLNLTEADGEEKDGGTVDVPNRPRDPDSSGR